MNCSLALVALLMTATVASEPTEFSFTKCGTSVSSGCIGRTVPMDEAGWEKFTSEFYSFVSFLVAQPDVEFVNLPPNLQKACTYGFPLFEGAKPAWNLFGAVWYLFLEFKLEAMMTSSFAEFYPYLCTCFEEASALAKVSGTTIPPAGDFCPSEVSLCGQEGVQCAADEDCCLGVRCKKHKGKNWKNSGRFCG
jgi:hypothetical protein